MSAASRQKSCDVCVRGKRKCGQERPVCARCEARGVRCTYQTPGNGKIQFPIIESGKTQLPSIDSTTIGFEPGLFSPEMPPFLGGFDESLIPTDGVQSIEELLSGLKSTSMPRDRVNFSVQQFISYPKLLVTQNRTPFIHPQLYHDIPMHPAIQDIYCVCALYLGKTEATSDNVFRIMHTKCSQLLEPHPNWSISDNLFCLQALCLFQIMRLFDGDIRQRAVAEQQETVLLEWTTELQRRTQNGQQIQIQEQEIQPSWYDWVFAESIRRTILISWMLQGVYAVIKQGFCYCSETVALSPFTAQAALWSAPTAYDWERAWHEKNHYSIKDMSFDTVMYGGDAACPSDLDDLGLTMMVTFLGTDRLRQWLARAGGRDLVLQ